VIGLEERQLDVGIDAGALLERDLGAHERVAALRGGAVAGGRLRLAEGDDVLRKRELRDDALQPRDRRPQPAAGDVGLREPGLGGRVVGHRRQGAAVVANGGVDLPDLQLEAAEQRAHVGVLLGDGAAGGDRRAHRAQSARQVAVQLAEVGDARVGGEIGLAIDHLLQRAAGLVVAAELDERVDERAERLVDHRRGGPRPLGVGQARAEVVARELERAELGQGARVAGLQREGAAHGALGADVEAGVTGLAHLLQVGAGEQCPAVGAQRGRADGGLELRDPHVGRVARTQRVREVGVGGGGWAAVVASLRHEDRERDGEGRKEADEDAAHGVVSSARGGRGRRAPARWSRVVAIGTRSDRPGRERGRARCA
jgi:hypothetical protein